MNYYKIPLPSEIQNKFYNFPYVAGIDINPMDYVPRDKEFAETQLLIYGIIYDVAQRYEELNKNGELESRLIKIEDICKTKFIRDNTLKQQLWKMSDNIAMLSNRDESDYLCEMGRRIRGQMNYIMPVEWFDETEWVWFEYFKIPVPKGYDGIWKLNYGEEYMKPRRTGAAHSYPFYKKQQEYLEQNKYKL